jgi:hypothetical protein
VPSVKAYVLYVSWRVLNVSWVTLAPTIQVLVDERGQSLEFVTTQPRLFTDPFTNGSTRRIRLNSVEPRSNGWRHASHHIPSAYPSDAPLTVVISPTKRRFAVSRLSLSTSPGQRSKQIEPALSV